MVPPAVRRRQSPSATRLSDLEFIESGERTASGALVRSPRTCERRRSELPPLGAADRGWSPAVFFESRGWSVEQQHDATTRLVERGLLVGSELAPSGVALRSQVEATTDAHAAEPFERALPTARRDDTLNELAHISADIVRSETIPFPNPMGLPHPDETTT